MKLIKTDARNRMGEGSLDSLMRISINGPPCNVFNYSKAIKLWVERKERRYKVRLL